MNATRKLTLAMALALASSNVLALGLGQIKVKSGLNEPLLAVIPVLIDDPDELRGLSAALASEEAFARAGLNFSRLEVPLEFNIVKRPDGSTVIEVTTDEAVAEPAVGFLLEVNWANGKLLREYSVLLDPPTIAPAVATQRTQPVTTTPAVAAPQPTTAAAPAPTPAPIRPTPVAPVAAEPVAAAPAVEPRAAEPAPTAPFASEYTVQTGDTLWGIASAAGAAAGVSVNRMMVALQTANPDAFFRDNINALKSGAVLRIPGGDELAQVRTADARAEVRRQNQAWADVHAAAPTLVARTGGIDAEQTRSPAAGGNADHLQLAAPGESGDGGESRAGVEDGTGTVAVAELQQEIARSKEALASEQQRSSELQARVQALEDLKNKNGSLLSLKNAEIAELQEQLRQAQIAADAAAAASVAQVPAAAATAVALREDIFSEEATATTAAATASAASVAPAATAAMAEAATTNMAGTSTVGAADAATAGLATAASIAAVEPELTVAPAVTEPAPPPVPAVVEEQTAASAGTPWYMQTWAWVLGGAALIAILLGALFSSRRSKAQQSSLADDYVEGYDPGDDRADQSDDEYALIDEIEQRPGDLALHLELASLYYALRDQNKFESAAESMYAHVDDPQQAEWQQVLAMGEELCPDHPLFADLHTDSDREHSDTDHEFDELDTDANAEPPTAAADAGDIRRSSERGYNFDFDLTPGTDEKRASAHEEVTPATDEFDADNEREPTLSDLASDGADGSVDDAGFSNDPVDTKLDLARAYYDMGDAEGARAMLEEVIAEGSQMQQDTARKLLQELD